MSSFPRATARIRSVSKAATARPTVSATPRCARAMPDAQTTAALWGAVVASGLYHGANPGMGWPLAVSAAMFERRTGALLKAVGALGLGHFAAMLAILAPFSAVTALVAVQQPLRFGAAALGIAHRVLLLLSRRH